MTIKPIRSSSLAFIGALSVGSTLAANALLRGDSLPQATRVVVAVVPLVFFFAFIWAELRWIRSQDEYHRAVLLESLAVAFPLAIAIAVVVESLQKAGLLANLTIGDVWPWMAVTWLPALWLARLRYK
jgi:hypothetical protein